MTFSARLEAVLTSRRLPIALAAAAALLAAPCLGVGLVVDDYVLRAVETLPRMGLGSSRPLDVFRFALPADVPGMMDDGILPWWTSPGLRLAFFRPLASASHWIDFHLLGGWSPAMHLFSLALAAAIAALAVPIYRRLLGPGWAAGLAALFFALDPGHAFIAGWISSRNALLAGLFGLAALLFHDRARRDGDRRAAWIAPVLTAASLASGEPGVATLGILAAHAIAFEPDLRSRARALGPHVAVGLAWAAIYRARGYGAAHSAMYVDPLASPVDFLRAAALYLPLDLGARLGGPPASIAMLLTPRIPALAAASLAFVIAALIAVGRLLRTDPAARFLAAAALLAVLPVSGTLPGDRNLIFVGFACFGLAALAVRRAVEEGGALRRLHAGWILLLFVVVAIPAGPANATVMLSFARLSRDPLSRALHDPAVAHETVVFVDPPTQFFVSHLRAMRAGTGEPIPIRTRTLFPGIYGARLSRLAPDRIAVHVDGGILPPPGSWPALPGAPPAMRWEYSGQFLTSFVRGPREPMRAGETVSLTGLRVEVTAVAGDGGPSDMIFTFDRPLEDPSLRWLVWRDGGYAPFTLPRVGEAVDLAPVSMAP